MTSSPTNKPMLPEQDPKGSEISQEPAPNLSPDPAANSAPDPFAPENLRLSQAFTEAVAVKKILTTVPVRKPAPQDFVRVHADPDFRHNFPIIELKDEREEYVVTSGLVPSLLTEVVAKTLYLAINRQGTVFFWPIRLPMPEGRDLDWWRSGRLAAEAAMKGWVRVRANMNVGAYDLFAAEANFPDPEWPADLGYWDLIKIAFRDHLIDTPDHAVLKRLRGLA
jgi:hypothetical protein